MIFLEPSNIKQVFHMEKLIDTFGLSNKNILGLENRNKAENC